LIFSELYYWLPGPVDVLPRMLTWPIISTVMLHRIRWNTVGIRWGIRWQFTLPDISPAHLTTPGRRSWRCRGFEDSGDRAPFRKGIGYVFRWRNAFWKQA